MIIITIVELYGSMSQLFEWRQLPFNMRVVLRSVSTFVDIWPENSLELAIVVLASSLHTMANGGHIDWQLVVQLEDGGGDVILSGGEMPRVSITLQWIAATWPNITDAMNNFSYG